MKPTHLWIWAPPAALTIAIPAYLGAWQIVPWLLIVGACWAMCAYAAAHVERLRDEEEYGSAVTVAEQARADRLAGDFRVPPPPAIRPVQWDADLDDDTGEFGDDPSGEEPAEAPARRDIWRCYAWLALLPGRIWASVAPSLSILRPALADEQAEPGRHRPPDEPDREATEPYRPRHGVPDPDETAELVPVAAITAHPHHEVAAAHVPLTKQHDDWRWSTVEFQMAADSFFAQEAAHARA